MSTVVVRVAASIAWFSATRYCAAGSGGGCCATAAAVRNLHAIVLYGLSTTWKEINNSAMETKHHLCSVMNLSSPLLDVLSSSISAAQQSE